RSMTNLADGKSACSAVFSFGAAAGLGAAGPGFGGGACLGGAAGCGVCATRVLAQNSAETSTIALCQVDRPQGAITLFMREDSRRQGALLILAREKGKGKRDKESTKDKKGAKNAW